MSVKRVGYKEPSDYFTPEMRKVAREWDKKNAEKQKEKNNSNISVKKK